MGQAKTRGTKDQRIAQSQAKTQPPKEGLYVTTKDVIGTRLVVEEVSDLEDDGFFLVTIIGEASANDLNAIRQELTSEEWFSFSDQFGLMYSQS